MPSTIIRPESDTIFAPLYWIPSSGSDFWPMIDETSQNGDTDYIYTKITEKFANVDFEDILDGENPPTNTNITISQAKIVTWAKKTLSSSAVDYGVSINGWTGSVLINDLTTDYAERSFTHTTNQGKPITVADINAARPRIEATVGRLNQCSVTQIYIEVTWEYNVSVHIKGNTLIKGGTIL